MSLSTILEIGKILRTDSTNPISHFKYAVKAPKETNKQHIISFVIPVEEDFTFRLDKLRLTNEKERESFYYLRYKASDSDTSDAKYIFGDIYYNVSCKIKELKTKNDSSDDEKCSFSVSHSDNSGDYVLFKSNAFTNGVKARERILHVASEKEKSALCKYWSQFSTVKDSIEKILLYAPILENNIECEDLEQIYKDYAFNHFKKSIKRISKYKKVETIDQLSKVDKDEIAKCFDHSVFIHFEFTGKKQWFKMDEMLRPIFTSLNNEITEEQTGGRIIMTKTLFQTLCSGDKKNDIQFPDFLPSNSYKSFSFENEKSFNNFLYAGKIIRKSRYIIPETNLELHVFPRSVQGQKISAKDYESFFFESKGESSLFAFDWLDEINPQEFQIFDFVITDNGGNSPVDIIEISGLSYSELVAIRKRIHGYEHDISQEANKELPGDWSLKVQKAIGDIYGNLIYNEKSGQTEFHYDTPRYKACIQHILPLVYKECYYQDDALLPTVLSKIEYSFRKGTKHGNFRRLKYDLMLLMSIQNNKINKYMEITSSPSYLLGVKVGKMTKPLRSAIKSFEKNYVGLLSRRVASREDCIKFINDIMQKLVMHDKAYQTLCFDAFDAMNNISSKEYDRNEFEFGFFEGYLKYEPKDKKQDFEKRLERLLNDYQNNEEMSEETSALEEFINKLYNNQENEEI